MIANVKEIKKKPLKTDHESFTTSEFPIYRGVGRKCSTFYSRNSNLFSEKKALCNL